MFFVVDVLFECVLLMIDEYFIFFMLVVCIEGIICMFGIGELCVKESDWLLVIVSGLVVCGVVVEVGEDYFNIMGMDDVLGDCVIEIYLDYCLVMFFFVLGFVVCGLIVVGGCEIIVMSFLFFVEMMRLIGVIINMMDEIV